MFYFEDKHQVGFFTAPIHYRLFGQFAGFGFRCFDAGQYGPLKLFCGSTHRLVCRFREYDLRYFDVAGALGMSI